MKLYEFEAKDIFRRAGIPCPAGALAFSAEEAEEAAARLGGKVIVKAQVLAGGRGRAGAVLAAEGPKEAGMAARKLLGSRVSGMPVYAVLVEEYVEHEQELYLGFTVDRSARRAVMLASKEGGVEIEEIARRHPEAITRRHIDPFLGLREYEARLVGRRLGLKGMLLREFSRIATALYKVFVEYMAELAEINPLAVTRDGKLIALDARLVIDDNALPHVSELPGIRPEAPRLWNPREKEARNKGLAYVELDGDIGIIGNGAGLTMATMDMVAFYGGRPACFLDIGGGARAEKVKEAVKLLLTNPRIKVVLINILGGITRCDEVARGIVSALQEVGRRVALVVRLSGTNEEEGRRILREAGIQALDSMEEAARMAVELARGVAQCSRA